MALYVSDETTNMSNIDADGDLLKNSPVFSPLAWSLVYQFPVHMMGPDYLPATPPEQASHLLVYRDRDDKVKFLNITPVTARLISLLENNETMDKVMTGAQAINIINNEIKHPDPDVVQQGGKATLEQLHQQGIILGTDNQLSMNKTP